MQLAAMRSLLFWSVAVLSTVALAGCDNPFDPLNTSSKIQGLTYFDFSATQEHWDSDPEWDGVQISISYYNEFGDQLSFHDKPHKITIEFWTENAEETPTVRGSLLTTKTIDFSNSDDLINIPVEYYGGSLGLPSAESITGCLLLRVFPPESYPQRELLFLSCGVEFFTPEEALINPR